MKYMGSKARLAKEISPIINEIIESENINTYIEPFVGGANMIQHIKCSKRIGFDNNEYLIQMWEDLKSGWTPPDELSKALYDDIKKNKDEYSKALVAIAGFCATYNAKWFGGYAGIVKTKINTYRNYYNEAVRNILKQVPLINDVKFEHADFSMINPIGALIYCDPPYQGTTQYGTSKDFDYGKFWNWIRDISKNNIVLISEYHAPDDFIAVYKKSLTTTLDKNSRKTDTERLFIHKSLIEKHKSIKIAV